MPISEQIRKRPAAFVGLAFAYTAFFCSALPQKLHFLPLVLIIVCLLLIFFPKTSSDLKQAAIIISIGVFAGSLLFFIYTDCYLLRIEKLYDGKEGVLTGVIREKLSSTSYSSEYVIKTESFDSKRCSFTALLRSDSVSLDTGDRVQCNVVMSKVPEYSGSFQQRKYSFSSGIAITAECEDTVIIDHEWEGLYWIVQNWRKQLTAALRYTLGKNCSGLPAALFLGDRSLLADPVKRDFRRSGLSHLLAVSGLHFTLLCHSLELAATNLIINRKVRKIILSFFIILYMMICGMSGSVVRTGIMMLIANIGAFFDREPDTATSLGVSLFLILLFNPGSAYSVSLLLSATSVLGILGYEHAKKILFSENDPSITHRRFLIKIAEFIMLPIIIQCLLMPFLCLYFGEASLLTPISSLLVTPLVQVILLLTPVLLCVRFIPYLGAVASFCLAQTSMLTETIASVLAHIPNSSFSLRSPAGVIFSIGIGLIGICIFIIKKKKTFLLLLVSTCLLVSVFFTGNAIENLIATRAIVLTTSFQKKNETLILNAGQKWTFLDISDGSYTSARDAFSTAREAGALDIDAWVYTHLHTKHIRQFSILTDNAYVQSAVIPIPLNETEKYIYDSLRQICEEKGIRFYEYERSPECKVTVNGVQIIVENNMLKRSSQPVVNIAMLGTGWKALYLGAAWSEAENSELPYYLPNADLVILGTHGPVNKTGFTLNAPNVRSIIINPASSDFYHEYCAGVFTQFTPVIEKEKAEIIFRTE